MCTATFPGGNGDDRGVIGLIEADVHRDASGSCEASHHPIEDAGATFARAAAASMGTARRAAMVAAPALSATSAISRLGRRHLGHLLVHFHPFSSMRSFQAQSAVPVLVAPPRLKEPHDAMACFEPVLMSPRKVFCGVKSTRDSPRR